MNCPELPFSFIGWELSVCHSLGLYNNKGHRLSVWGCVHTKSLREHNIESRQGCVAGGSRNYAQQDPLLGGKWSSSLLCLGVWSSRHDWQPRHDTDSGDQKVEPGSASGAWTSLRQRPQGVSMKAIGKRFRSSVGFAACEGLLWVKLPPHGEKACGSRVIFGAVVHQSTTFFSRN